MTRVDRRKATASEFRRLFLRLTGRLKRSADRGEGGDADLRLDFADVNAARIGASPPSEALTRSPLPAGDPRFIPREDIRAAIEHSHAAWREGRPTLIALTGPSGCGLTSILNQTPRWLPADTLVARIGVLPMLTSATPESPLRRQAATPTIAQSCARRLNFWKLQPAPPIFGTRISVSISSAARALSRKPW